MWTNAQVSLGAGKKNDILAEGNIISIGNKVPQICGLIVQAVVVVGDTQLPSKNSSNTE